jgi:hypothetical protein
MSMTKIRSIVVSTQETLRESGAEVNPATVKVIAAAVVTNPLAGKALVQDLTELEMMSIEVTGILAERDLGSEYRFYACRGGVDRHDDRS